MPVTDLTKVPKAKSSNEKVSSKATYVTDPVKKPTRRVVQFHLISERKPTTVSFKAEDIVDLGDGKGLTAIRYANGQRTIIKDDQPDFVKKPDYLLFMAGILTVQSSNTALLEFLRKSNSNANNPNRLENKQPKWIEYDPDAISQKQFEEEVKKLDAVRIALEADTKKAFGMAMMLGGKPQDALDAKLYLKNYADRDPAKIIELNGDPTLEKKSNFLLALSVGVMRVDEKGRVLWGSGNSAITIVPAGIEPHDHMYEFFRTEDGGVVYNQMMEKLEK